MLQRNVSSVFLASCLSFCTTFTWECTDPKQRYDYVGKTFLFREQSKRGFAIPITMIQPSPLPLEHHYSSCMRVVKRHEPHLLLLQPFISFHLYLRVRTSPAEIWLDLPYAKHFYFASWESEDLQFWLHRPDRAPSSQAPLFIMRACCKETWAPLAPPPAFHFVPFSP